MDKKVVSTNRKAFHDYLIFDKFDAGVVLTGTEIKSVRKGMLNLKDSFAKIEDGEVLLYNMHISPYEHGNRYNHESDRVRKLLLHKNEIMKILGKIKKENFTIVPLELYLSHGFAKIQIGLAKGKKLYDKREAITKKTQERDIARKVR
ncbi:MAG: SsrA-binding protein SmpB [bacterium]|nr:SsrA-binding protein SmpB [bacterium]